MLNKRYENTKQLLAKRKKQLEENTEKIKELEKQNAGFAAIIEEKD